MSSEYPNPEVDPTPNAFGVRDPVSSGQGVLGVIPARGGSKGVRRKNVRSLGGKPLIAHAIEAAREAECIARFVVSTDDCEIAQVARSWGAEIPFLRPPELATDQAAMVPVIIHAVEWLEQKGAAYPTIVVVQPTSPFISASLIDSAYARFLELGADTLVSLAKVEHHPYWLKTVERGYAFPFLNIPGLPTRRQDLPSLYAVNGAVYITSRDMLLKKKGRECSFATQIEGEKVGVITVEDQEALEIDTEMNLRMADLIFSVRQEI